MINKEPVMLVILDGWGLGEEYPGNAIYLGNTPNFDNLMKNYPNSKLDASGLEVGLPQGQMGNSEVGHLNIGSGRVIYQDLPRITKEIEEGNFFNKEEFLGAIENAKNNNSKIHLIGLVSDGGVHSHMKHLFALLELMKKEDFKDVYVHAILDGRDVPPNVGKEQLKMLKDKMDELGVGKIATVSGRYYTMDRDKRWERTELAYNAIVKGIGADDIDPIEVVEKSYNGEIFDEFIMPTVIKENDKPLATIDNKDSIIFFNFRPDRARQLTRAIVDENFDSFDRGEKVDTHYVTMTQYDKTIENVIVAYKSTPPERTLSEYIDSLGYSQVKIAETEKYAHVTFFFNGGIEEPYSKEDRILVPSPKVATYDLEPKMSADGVKENVINSLDIDRYDLIVVNFANPDMVGHTGKIPKVVEAIEKVDKCLGEVLEKAKEKNAKVLITADHGNAEKLLDENNNPVTAHTTNKVPLILFGSDKMLNDGKLADIAPTLLELMNIEKPEEMTGNSLLK